MPSVGYATLDIIPSVRGIQRSIAGQIDGPLRQAGKAAGGKLSDGLGDGVHSGQSRLRTRVDAAARNATGGASAIFGRAGKQAGDKFGDGVKSAKSAVVGAIGAIGVGALTAKALEAADSLEASNIKIEGAFGESAAVVTQWASTTATQLGLSQAAGEDMAGTFGQMFHAMGLSQTEAAGMSTQLSGLVQNVAKFNNADPASVQSAFTAAMRGRGKALIALGINMDSTTIAAEALSHGIVKTSVDQGKVTALTDAYNLAVQHQVTVDRAATSSAADKTAAVHQTAAAQAAITAAMQGGMPVLTQSQKGEAAYYAILDGTKNQMNAVADSSNTLAQKKKVLGAEVANLEAKLGNALLPTLTKFAGYLTDTVIPAISDFGGWVNKNKAWLGPLAGAVGAAASAFWLTQKAVLAVNAVMALSAGIAALFGGGEAVAAGGAAALGAASAGAAGGVGALNIALLANPIGAVVAAVALLAVGLYELWKHCETFRDIVTLAFNTARDVVLTVVRTIVNAFLSVIAAVLHGAAAAFGWIPGIGGKLKSARDAFDSFRDGVNASLGGIMDKTVSVTVTIDDSAAQAYWASHPAPGMSAPAAATAPLTDAASQNYWATHGAQTSAMTTTMSGQHAPGLSAAQKEAARQAAAAAAAAAKDAASAAAATLKDASTTMRKAGGDLMGSLAYGIAHHKFDMSTITDKLKTFRAAISAVIAAGGNVSASVVAKVASSSTRLEALGKIMDKTVAKMTAAKDKLATLNANIATLKGSVHDAVTGSFDVVTAGVTQDKWGVTKATTGSSILADLKVKVKAAHSFAVELANLRKRGLNSTLLAELAQAGPAAEPQARALYASSQATLNAINGQYKSLSGYGTSAGNTASQSMYASGVAAAKGIIKGLQSQETAITKQMNRIAKIMEAAIKKALKIASPSGVGRDIGANYAASIAKGSEDNKAKVIAAMRGISDALTVNPNTSALGQLLAGQQTAGGRSVTVTQHINNPLPEKASVSGPAGLRRAAYALGR